MRKEYDVIVVGTAIGGATNARKMAGKGHIRCTFFKVTIIPFFTRRKSFLDG